MSTDESVDFMDGIEIDEEVQDLELCPEGEHELRIVSFRPKVDEKNDPPEWKAYSISLLPVDNDNADWINSMIFLPIAGMEPRRKADASRDLKNFCEAFGLGWPPPMPFDPDEIKGLTCWAHVGHREGNRGVEAVVRQWVKSAK